MSKKMSKKKKVIIILLVVLAVILISALVLCKIAVDYVFDKAYNEIINENIRLEEEQLKEKDIETVTGEDGETYELSGEDDTDSVEITGSDGKTYNVKKPAAEDETPPPRIKRVSELSGKEIADIQAMVTTADKVAVMNICKSAATAEDRREVKAMLESGTLNYGRVKEILSQRLSAAQKAQIYAYYEKYAAIYFGVE